jgi:hypothetical protein
MRKILLSVAAVATLTFLVVAPDRAKAQGTNGSATIYTSPANGATYTPSYATVSTYTPSYVTSFTPSYTLAPSYIPPSVSYSEPYRPSLSPRGNIAYSPDGLFYAPTTNAYTPSYLAQYPASTIYNLENGYPYYNPMTGTYYNAPTFNPGAVYGYNSPNYPPSYASYRTFWNGVRPYRVWSQNPNGSNNYNTWVPNR